MLEKWQIVHEKSLNFGFKKLCEPWLCSRWNNNDLINHFRNSHMSALQLVHHLRHNMKFENLWFVDELHIYKYTSFLMVGNVSSTELAIPMAGTNLPLHFTLTKGVIQFRACIKKYVNVLIVKTKQLFQSQLTELIVHLVHACEPLL